MTEELYNAIAFKCLDMWMSNREKSKYIQSYLHYKGVKKIGIYGYGILGKHLISELHESNIEIIWVMDKKDLKPINSIKTVHLEDKKMIDEPELVIVASIRYYEEIEKELISIGYKNIRSIEEIIEDISSWKES